MRLSIIYELLGVVCALITMTLYHFDYEMIANVMVSITTISFLISVYFNCLKK